MAWMFDKELTLEELNEAWKESIETTHIVKKKMPMRLYQMAKHDYELTQKENLIIDKVHESIRRKIKKVFMINDDMAIIETFEKLFGDKEQTWYRVYYDGNVDSTVTTSFDSALIQLVCLKNNSLEATSWICKMLGIKEEY